MQNKLTLLLTIAATVVLSACNSVSDYRDDSIKATTPDIELTSTPEVVEDIKPAQDYSMYKDAKDLQIINMQEGTGERKSVNGDKISVHYSGFLTDGTSFDSSKKRNTPFEFTLGTGAVIKGWDEGFLDKKKGDKFTIIIPSEKAYGSVERPSIPANSVLVFEVEVMDVIAKQ